MNLSQFILLLSPKVVGRSPKLFFSKSSSFLNFHVVLKSKGKVIDNGICPVEESHDYEKIMRLFSKILEVIYDWLISFPYISCIFHHKYGVLSNMKITQITQVNKSEVFCVLPFSSLPSFSPICPTSMPYCLNPNRTHLLSAWLDPNLNRLKPKINNTTNPYPETKVDKINQSFSKNLRTLCFFL